jgi:hypothetical protein
MHKTSSALQVVAKNDETMYVARFVCGNVARFVLIINPAAEPFKHMHRME